MAKKLDLKDPKRMRLELSQNQQEFWGRYGVTQSGGSRYENGRDMPLQVRALIWLHRSGKIDDKTLAQALKAAQ